MLYVAYRARGLTRAKIAERFLKEVYAPALAGFVPEGNADISNGTGNSRVYGTRAYRHPDGRKVEMMALAKTTASKAVVYPCLAQMVLAVAQAKGGTGTANERIARGLSAVKPKMEAIGITGAILNSAEGSRFYAWDEWIGKYAGS